MGHGIPSTDCSCDGCIRARFDASMRQHKQAFGKAVPEPRKRVILESSDKFRLVSQDGRSTTPLVKLSDSEIRIGCHTISRSAWVRLNKLWDEHLCGRSTTVQEGDEA